MLIAQSTVSLMMSKMVIRVLGGVVGFLAILVGVLLVYRYWPESIQKLIVGIAMIGMGGYFLSYAITGKTRTAWSKEIK